MADGRAIRAAMRLHLRQNDPGGGALLKRQNRAMQRALDATTKARERTVYVPAPVQPVARVIHLPQRTATPSPSAIYERPEYRDVDF